MPDPTPLALPPPPGFGGWGSVPRGWWRRLARWAPALVWRVTHPAAREHFTPRTTLPALARLPLSSLDARASGTLRRMDPGPCASGEPVVLAAGLGLDADVFRWGARSLAQLLLEAGFRVYLYDPGHPSSAPTFDALARWEVAAALRCAAADAGAVRAHWVGHGVGGQLAIAGASLGADAHLAGLAVLGAAVVFPRDVAAVGGAGLPVPRGWRLPVGALGTVAAVATPGSPHATEREGERRRGALHHSTQAIPLDLLRHARRWLRHGALTDEDGLLDYLPGTQRVRVPLWWTASEEDAWAPPRWCAPLGETWGGDVERGENPTHGDHLDLALAEGEEAWAELLGWLHATRARAWFDEEDWCTPAHLPTEAAEARGEGAFRRRR